MSNYETVEVVSTLQSTGKSDKQVLEMLPCDDNDSIWLNVFENSEKAKMTSQIRVDRQTLIRIGEMLRSFTGNNDCSSCD